MPAFLITLAVVAAFIALLVTLVLLRSKYPKLEIKTTDLAVALVVIALWLLLSGKITKMQVGDVSFETIFTQAASAKVTGQVSKVSPLTVRAMRVSTKGSVAQVTTLLTGRSEAVSFQLGNPDYQSTAVQEYLALSGKPFLKQLIFNDAQGKFVALADARAVWYLVDKDTSANHISISDLTHWIVADDRAALAKLPGYIASAEAVGNTWGKKRVLENMVKSGRQALPVLDAEGKFIGMVDQASLTTSMILDISDRIKVK